MSGIYIHIPFCKKACHYCDFHFSTSIKNKEEIVNALCHEIELRSDYLANKNIATLYFGGGTPSLLTQADILKIIDTVKRNFDLDHDAEVTLEANPDDLSVQKVQEIKSAGINRLSIGIQSFFDEDLALMNRSHTAEQAITAVKNAQKTGFQNISIDLIYGLPNLTPERWEHNLKTAFELDVPHLSAYNLTIEEKTAFNHFVKEKKIQLPPEPIVIEQFNMLIERANQQGFIHYEISNFAKEGRYSRHNSSYWKNDHYLGIGPSAHSYNGSSRQWNIANNSIYIERIKSGQKWYEQEILSEADKYNEYVMTRLRTIWGIDISHIKKTFGAEQLQSLLEQSQPYISSGHILHKGESITLTEKGKLLADKIASEFFI